MIDIKSTLELSIFECSDHSRNPFFFQIRNYFLWYFPIKENFRYLKEAMEGEETKEKVGCGKGGEGGRQARENRFAIQIGKISESGFSWERLFRDLKTILDNLSNVILTD